MTRAPGPRRRFPGSHMFAMRRDPLAFLTKLSREYGDVARFRMGPVELHLLNRPEWIRDLLVTHAASFHKGRGLQRAKRLLGDGLLTSEDPKHLRQRRMMQPAFHHQRIQGYGEVMAEHAARTSDRWRDGETRDLAQEMTRLTLAIVGRTLFDSDVESEADEIGGALTTALGLFASTLTLPFMELFDRLPTPSNRRFERARARIDATIYRMIEERRRAPGARTDLLSLLLLAADTEGDGGGMTDTEVRDEAITLFLAGHETTANALTWTWYLLSQNPEAEARLHAEVDAVLAARPAGAGDLPRLPYTEMVLAESMRLFPPAWIVGRRALAAYEVGGFSRAEGLDRRREPVGDPPRPAPLPGPGTLRPRALAPRGARSPPEVLLLSLRGRPARLHRGKLRVDGGNPAARDARAGMAAAPRSRSDHRAVSVDHAAPEARHEDDAREAALTGAPRVRATKSGGSAGAACRSRGRARARPCPGSSPRGGRSIRAR